MPFYAVFLPPVTEAHPEARPVLLPLGACGKTATTLGVVAEFLSRTFPASVRLPVIAVGVLLGGVLPPALHERGLLMRGYRRVATIEAANEEAATHALREALARRSPPASSSPPSGSRTP